MNLTSGTWRWLMPLALLFFCLPTVVNADETGGFITQSQGQVTFQPAGGEVQPLPAFVKVASGTHITMAEGAKLRIIYLSGGRQESWAGKVEIVTGDTESKAVGESAGPTVKNLPPFLVETLVKSQGVIANIHERQGMIRVRSLLTATKIKKAQERYAELRAQAADDDITPEIFLLTTLDGLKAYKSMKNPLEEMLQRQPDNAEAQALYDHFTQLLNMGAVEGGSEPAGE